MTTPDLSDEEIADFASLHCDCKTMDDIRHFARAILAANRERQVSQGPVSKEWCATYPASAAFMINHLAQKINASPPAVPEGFVLVPKEPTVGMLTAGSYAIDLHSHSPLAIWAAMLSAAPQPAGEPST